MTYEEFYGKKLNALNETKRVLESKAESMRTSCRTDIDVQPVIYYCSRIKSPDSMIAKLSSRGFPVSLESSLANVYDSVGIRIICSFAEDVMNVVDNLENDPSVEIIEKKNYLLNPKQNGYRSVHLCIRLADTGMLAEIQIRTITMDFWATLEHQLKYKKNISNEQLIKSELKRCADEIASVDLSMQTLRDIIRKN